MSEDLQSESVSSASEKGGRRKIPGGLPYTSASGVLRRIIDKIPTSEKPSVFNTDFLGTVMGATGGSARPIIPILKATGLLNQNGGPTELYGSFQTESGRAAAALQALQNGFREIFRRNQYAHRASEQELTDYIVAITGLPKRDAVVRYILNTFQVFQDVARSAKEGQPTERHDEERVQPEISPSAAMSAVGNLQLCYNINIVLPETTNVEVFNAIFRSLRGNLLS